MTFADFAKKFKLLSESEKNVLKVMTVYHEALSQTDLVSLLRACEIRKDNDRAYIPSDIRELKKKLMNSGWLSINISSRLECSSKYKEYLMRVAILDESFNFWLKFI